MGGDIGVGATCRRGRQWGTERCFIPCSGGSLRLSLGSSETVTFTAETTLLECGWCKTPLRSREEPTISKGK